MTIARYAFLPWLRRGVANQIQTTAVTTSRARLQVALTVGDGAETRVIDKDIQLVGPGDVLGINPQEIIRTEPRGWVTDFEPNFFAFAEFYDEDFPWRYTPDRVDLARHRLTPWLTLLLLKESEFTPNRTPGRPLFSIKLATATKLDELIAPDDQLWAWAHGQIADALGAGDGTTPDLAALEQVLRENADRGVSRLMSPRRLEPDTGYYAFLIPSFEAGRRAGLGLDVPATQSGLALAWTTAREFPVYYEWFFRTGERGDFEELVRRLVPRDAHPDVGIRDLDIRRPGFGIGPIVNPPGDRVGLEGALVAPTATPRGLNLGNDFAAKIQTIVNAPADLVATGAVGSDDPLIAPPLYGRWHALVERLDTAPAVRNWVNEASGDPRYRAAAGMGTLVVQTNQEGYMKLAWQQIGEVLAANRKITLGQTAMFASFALHAKSFAIMPAAQSLPIAAPVFKRVLGSATTIAHQIGASRVPPAAFATGTRKLARPRGLVARRSFEARAAVAGRIAAAINDGEATAAPPAPPPGEPTLEGAASRVSSSLPEWLRALIRDPRRLLMLLLLVLLLLAMVGLFGGAAALPVVIGLAAAAVVAAWSLWRQRERVLASEAVDPANMTAAAAAAAPGATQFALYRPGELTPPPGSVETAAGAEAFRTALIGFNTAFEKRRAPPPEREAADLGNAHLKVVAAIDPLVAHPRRLTRQVTIGGLTLGEHVRDTYRDPAARADPLRLATVMAYPDLRQAMYEPLRDLSAELLVPNLDLIPTNTLSLLIANERFIEAYMLGLNHEFARELLWREYPTDQRGSSFRQFWDVSAHVDRVGLPPKALAESLKDITPIDTWATTTRLGSHNNRGATSPGDRVVLVIRGDLLKRYPNTMVYAQRAKWGSGDRIDELILWDETGEIVDAAPDDPNIRFPLFKAEIRPDLHFIGFNLSLDEVRGDQALAESAEARATIPADRLGWFFVIQEVVGEPRFGLDESLPAVAAEEKWDNLSWANLGAVKRVDLAKPFVVPVAGTRNTAGLDWHSNAADLAAILYQKPVMVGVHGRRMLKNLQQANTPWPD
jgi:hypothetical protein